MLFAQVFDKITGVDVNDEFLMEFKNEIALRNLGQLLEAHSLDEGRIPVADGSIDCLMSFTVLEHVEDEMAVLKEMHRVLKPGGKLILTVPNRWWVFETHGADLPLLPWNRVPFVSWWPKSLHDRFARARIYRKREIKAMVEEAGFTVTDNFNMTAPMDMIKWRPLRRFLQATLFRFDRTPFPVLATEIMLAAQR
jgi:ubiquinone/menaquinone biosynthesis C-methylase UbiE